MDDSERQPGDSPESPGPLFDLLGPDGEPYPAEGLPPTAPDGSFWTWGPSFVWRPPGPGNGLAAWLDALGLEEREVPNHPVGRGPDVEVFDPPGAKSPTEVTVVQEGSAPGSSYKERGAEVLGAVIARRGLKEVFLDSSGNAGIAVAQACTRRYITCRVLVPETTPEIKLERLEDVGARLRVITGDRQAAYEAGQKLRDKWTWVSHIAQPAFQAGVATLAWELHQAESRGEIPPVERVVLPAGHGALLLGLHLGFERLVAAGRRSEIPALHAVQLAGYATLADRVDDASDDGLEARPGTPTAMGVAIAEPPRLDQMAAAVNETGGSVTVVSETQIAAARTALAARGRLADPTGATAWAGLVRRRDLAGPGTVVVLTSR